jgi:ribonuclease-3
MPRVKEAHPTISLEELEQRLGYRFRDRELLHTALTHPSATPSAVPQRMEQLEFLGDAVLGFVLSALLLEKYPDASEGRLSQYRAQLVNTQSLAAKARELGLGEALQLGRGEEKTGGRQKPSILAGAFEALLGSMYLDGGLDPVREFLARFFQREIALLPERRRSDAKTALQEFCQARLRETPRYVTVAESGPDHARWFVVEARIGGRIAARGEGKSKRAAEQEAARRALEQMRGEF